MAKRSYTIYDLHLKTTGQDSYYGSLAALVNANPRESLGIGIDSLYHHDWGSKPKYENEKITIIKGAIVSMPWKNKAGKPLKAEAPAKKKKAPMKKAKKADNYNRFMDMLK